MRWVGLLAGLALTGCAGSGLIPRNAATAELMDAQHMRHGNVTVRPNGGSLRLHAEVRGVAPGSYGIHIHQAGSCLGPDFKTAGGHWNPGGKQHGRDNPMGAHMGDLPNVGVGADGRGVLDATVPGNLAELIDADGASVVLHAAADDYRTDPSGNSGARVACGVLLRLP